MQKNLVGPMREQTLNPQERGASQHRRTLAVLRKGNMGDLLLTEPVVRVLRQDFHHVTLYTDFPAVGALIDAYDEILQYDGHCRIAEGQYHRVIELDYESYPGMNHLDGYARSAGIQLRYRTPRTRSGFRRVVPGQYGLIAPHTSDWRRPMREWPTERFAELASCLERRLGFPFLLLDPAGCFDRMVSLVEHCTFFVGNDSGPAILAQSFGRPTFVIFGATRPDLILVSDKAVAIISDVKCNGCLHFARYTGILCATPMCLETLSVDAVFAEIVARL